MLHVQKISLGIALALVACGRAASSQWDPQASSALRAQPESILRDLDAGNFDGMLAKIDDESIVLDLDENNQPVRYEGREKVTQYFRHLEQGAKAQGLKFKTTIAKNDCSATASIGYCVVEFDQTILAGGQNMGPFKFRATIISRKLGDEWRWTHWHGSFREMPSSPGTASMASSTSATAK